MLAEMSSRQFTEWQAFWQVEPWGPYREDWRMACLMALVGNMMRGKDQAAIMPAEFMAMLDPTGETEPPLKPADLQMEAFEANWQKMLGEA